MSFLKRLFGREQEEKSDTGYKDPTGIYLYVKCDRCGTGVKVRADKKYDLENSDSGYSWHKTIVDSKCFRPMQTVVHFNRDYEVISAQLEGGEYITEADYTAWLAAKEAEKLAAQAEESIGEAGELETPGKESA